MVDVGLELRRAREAAGLSQAQVADAAGTSQARVSSYESGKVTPSPETRRRLLAAVRPRPSALLSRHRAAVKRLATEHGLSHVRVFGSVARGVDTPESDVDLLVTPAPKTSLVDITAFALDVEDLLGTRVDVVSDRGIDPGSSIAREARPL